MKNKTGRVRGINKFLINFSFFICIFLTSFSKNEVTTIEALPQREKANLDIEVLKIKTEKITGVIYENENKIIFDFKDLKKAAEKKRIVTDSNNYEIFILENLDNAATYMKKNEKFKMNRVFEQGVKLRNGEKIKLKNISYGLIEQNREKVLEVYYDLKPETFYLGVINNKTGLVEKIYRAEFTQEQTTIHSNTGSISDFKYSISNNNDIIIETNHLGPYISEPITIQFEQLYNNNSNLFPVITIGDESIWKRINHNGMIPLETPQKNIEIDINSDYISGKITPQLKYLKSYPKENITFIQKLYFHNVLENFSNKIAIGAYEKEGNEFIEAQVFLKIDAKTIEEIKEYAKNIPINNNKLVEIPYNNLLANNKITLTVGSSDGNGFYTIPALNLNNNKVTINYPKIYIKQANDEFDDYFTYDISNLTDHIIEESSIDNIPSGYYTASFGNISINSKHKAKNQQIIPVVGLGNQKEWAHTGKISSNIDTNIKGPQQLEGIRLNLGIPKDIYPYLQDSDHSGYLFKKHLIGNIGVTLVDRAITLGAYGSIGNIVTDFKILIPTATITDIKNYAYNEENKNKDIVEIPYSGDYKISLIPSSTDSNRTKIYIPDTSKGITRTILYPKIKFKKKGNEINTGNFKYSHTLKEKIVDEQFLLDYKDSSIEFGSVEFSQKTLNNNSDTLIPMIALGNKSEVPNGYLFHSISYELGRNYYNIKLNSEIEVKPYFINLKSELLSGNSSLLTGKQEDQNGNNLGIFAYSHASKEKVSGTLNIDITSSEKLKILSYARGMKGFNISFFNVSDYIAFIIGEYTGAYKFPLNNQMSNIIEIPYPHLKVIKDQITNNNIQIEFKNDYKKGTRVDFDFVGNSNNPNVEVNLNSGHFINGLELNDGTLSVIYENKEISIILEPNKENELRIDNTQLKIDIIYNKNGLASMILNHWNNNPHIFKIVHKEKSGLIRREYTVMLKTPEPSFEIITKNATLDFGTVLKGDNSKTATSSKIVVKNPTGQVLNFSPSSNSVDLKNGDSIITAGEFEVIPMDAKKDSAESHFMLKGKLTNTSEAIEGEHTGQFYLNIELK